MVTTFILVFVLTHWVTDPINQLLPLEASQQERDSLRQKLGLDKPVLVQLYDYSKGAIRGDFGNSWWQDRPATQIVMERIPMLLQLVLSGFVFAMIVGLLLGILAALRPRGLLDKICSTGSMIGICLPHFWAGLVLIIIVAVELRWFPTSGAGSWRHLVLPAFTLAILPIGRMVEIVRSAMLDQMREQYIITARAKGVSETLVVIKHALKNAGITIVTMGGWELGRMLAGYTVAIEVVFGYPGLGHLIVDTIGRGDFPLLQAITVLVGVVISMLNLLVDLSYVFFDPRVKYE